MNNIKCKLCDRNCKSLVSLGLHIVKGHRISTKEYYDIYLKQEENKCTVCKNPTIFRNLNVGYGTTCSRTCARKLCNTPDSRLKYEQTCLKKYGVKNTMQIDSVKKKNSEAQIKNFSNSLAREKTSISTRNAMNRDDVKKNILLHNLKPKSKETLHKMSEASKLNYIKYPNLKNKIYTKERNEKISKSKIEYWKNNPDKKIRVANIWRILKNKDENKWREHLLRASKLGFEKIFSPNGDTSLEIKLYKMFEIENIQYIKKYVLDGKIYDAYLPEYSILLEIDGEFWHPLNLEECKYKFQEESFHNDRLKEEIAKKNGIKLIRIRENQIPKTIKEIL